MLVSVDGGKVAEYCGIGRPAYGLYFDFPLACVVAMPLRSTFGLIKLPSMTAEEREYPLY